MIDRRWLSEQLERDAHGRGFQNEPQRLDGPTQRIEARPSFGPSRGVTSDAESQGRSAPGWQQGPPSQPFEGSLRQSATGDGMGHHETYSGNFHGRQPADFGGAEPLAHDPGHCSVLQLRRQHPQQ